jgi:hypothetical protein
MTHPNISQIVLATTNRTANPSHHKKKSRIMDLEKRAKNVAEHPDWYQTERANHLGVSQPSIWVAFRELNIRHKKNAKTSPSKRSAQRGISGKNHHL